MQKEKSKIFKQYIDLQYFGSIKLYSTLINCTNVIFSSSIPFSKSLHVNRTKLMGANGPLLLTIPLVGGRDKKQLLKDVQISYTDPWRQIHWKGIKSGYSKAPWFEEYAPELEIIYNHKEKFLVDWNLYCMQWAIQKLKLPVDILAETTLNNDVVKNRRDETNHLKSYPVYQQVFSERHGFIPNLSVLDLLLCEGPLATNYLGSLPFDKKDR